MSGPHSRYWYDKEEKRPGLQNTSKYNITITELIAVTIGHRQVKACIT